MITCYDNYVHLLYDCLSIIWKKTFTIDLYNSFPDIDKQNQRTSAMEGLDELSQTMILCLVFYTSCMYMYIAIQKCLHTQMMLSILKCEYGQNVIY